MREYKLTTTCRKFFIQDKNGDKNIDIVCLRDREEYNSEDN